jgi:hypothetical protein
MHASGTIWHTSDTHTHTHIHIHAHMHARTLARTTHTHTQTQTHTHTHTHTHPQTQTHIHKHNQLKCWPSVIAASWRLSECEVTSTSSIVCTRFTHGIPISGRRLTQSSCHSILAKMPRVLSHATFYPRLNHQSSIQNSITCLV